MKQRAIPFALVPSMLLVALCAGGCHGDGTGSVAGTAIDTSSQSCNVPFVDVMHHNFAYFSTENFRVIDNSDDWCALWYTMSGDTAPGSCDPTLVDFSREVAILAANPSAVWETITCIQGDEFSARARVMVEESYFADPGCLIPVRAVNPVHVVKVKRVPVVATFKKVLIDVCPGQ